MTKEINLELKRNECNKSKNQGLKMKWNFYSQPIKHTSRAQNAQQTLDCYELRNQMLLNAALPETEDL